MGLLLTISRIYLPGVIRKKRMDDLFQATAHAFQCQVPCFKARTFNRYLTRYALFTREYAERSIRQGNTHEVKKRLYDNAYSIGQNIRKELNIQTTEELMQACEVIYKALKIDLHGDNSGNLTMQSCFFSEFYSVGVCNVISSMDEGLITGLSGGLRLEFYQRITEGKECCKARIITTGSPI